MGAIAQWYFLSSYGAVRPMFPHSEELFSSSWKYLLCTRVHFLPWHGVEVYLAYSPWWKAGPITSDRSCLSRCYGRLPQNDTTGELIFGLAVRPSPLTSRYPNFCGNGESFALRQTPFALLVQPRENMSRQKNKKKLLLFCGSLKPWGWLKDRQAFSPSLLRGLRFGKLIKWAVAETCVWLRRWQKERESGTIFCRRRHRRSTWVSQWYSFFSQSVSSLLNRTELRALAGSAEGDESRLIDVPGKFVCVYKKA